MNQKRSNTSISSPLDENTSPMAKKLDTVDVEISECCENCFRLEERMHEQNLEWSKKYQKKANYIAQQNANFEVLKKKWDERHQSDDQFNKYLWEHREDMAKEYSKIQEALIQKYEADAYSMKLQIQDLEERLEMSEAKNERLLLRRMEDREKMRTSFEEVGKKIEKNDEKTTTTANKSCTDIVEESEHCQNCLELNKEMQEQEMELVKKHQEKVDQLDQKLEEYKSQKEEEVRDMQLASLQLELKIENLMEQIKQYEEEEKLIQRRQDGWQAIVPFNPYEKRNPEAKILALEETIKVFKRETDLLRVYLEANTTEIRSLEDRLREEKRKADKNADYYEAKIERLYTRLHRKNERIAELEDSSSETSDDSSM